MLQGVAITSPATGLRRGSGYKSNSFAAYDEVEIDMSTFLEFGMSQLQTLHGLIMQNLDALRPSPPPQAAPSYPICFAIRLCSSRRHQEQCLTPLARHLLTNPSIGKQRI